MKKKQTFLQKFKTWWHNLPHQWFLVFQLCLLFVFYLSCLLTGYSPFFILIIPLLLIIQFYFIKHYYGWKILFTIFIVLSATISLAFFLHHIDHAMGTKWLYLFLLPFPYITFSLLAQGYSKKMLLSCLFILVLLIPLRYRIIWCSCDSESIIFDCCDKAEWALFWWKYPLTNRKRYYEIQKDEQDFELHTLYFQENED